MYGIIHYQNLKSQKYYTFKTSSFYRFYKMLTALLHNKNIKVWEVKEDWK